MSESKRRRVSEDKDLHVVQPMVVGSTPTEAVVVDPELEELPRILMVELQKENTEDVAGALEDLGKLFEAEETDNDDDEGIKTRKEAIGLGAILALVTTLKKWSGNKNIQGGACRCLAQVAYISGADVAVTKLGGIEAVVSAMKRFPESEVVQKACVWVLRNVLNAEEDAEQSSRDITKRYVEEFAGVALIIKAMKAFPESAGLQLHSCALFYNISLSKEFHDSLLKEGTTSTAALAAEQHSENDKIKKATGDFIKNMFP